MRFIEARQLFFPAKRNRTSASTQTHKHTLALARTRNDVNAARAHLGGPLDGDIAWLEIDDNVQIRIARQALQRKVDTAKGDTAVPSDNGSGRSTKIEPSDGSESDEPAN